MDLRWQTVAEISNKIVNYSPANLEMPGSVASQFTTF